MIGIIRSALAKHAPMLTALVSIVIAVVGCDPSTQLDAADGTSIQETTVDGIDVRQADSAGVRIVETLRPRGVETSNRWRVAAAPEFRIGSAFDEPTMLAGVTGIAYGPAGEIVVANAQTLQIKMFSAAGEPIWSQGRVGDGPGEYRGFRTVEHCGGHILVADLQSRRFTLLNGAGEVTATRLWHPLRRLAAPFRLSCTDDGAFVQLDRESNPPAEEGSYTVPAIIGFGRVGGESPEPILAIPGIDRRRHGTVDGPADFGKTTWAVALPQGVIVIQSTTTEFRTYDAEGHLSRVARWMYSPKPITSGVLRSEVTERESSLPRSMRSSYRKLWLSLDHPDYLPAIDTIVPADNGGFWARRFQLRSESLPLVEWWRVGSDGVLRGIVEVPADFTLFRVVPGAVLGLVRDSLGVEYVEKRLIHAQQTSG